MKEIVIDGTLVKNKPFFIQLGSLEVVDSREMLYLSGEILLFYERSQQLELKVEA